MNIRTAALTVCALASLVGCTTSGPAVRMEATAERPFATPVSRLLIVLEVAPAEERALARVGSAVAAYVRPYRTAVEVVIADTSGIVRGVDAERTASFAPEGVLRMRLRQDTKTSVRPQVSMRTSTPGMSIPVGGGVERRTEGRSRSRSR